MTVPDYNARWLHLTVHRDCLSRAVTHMRSHSYLYAFYLLLPLDYVGVNNDDGIESDYAM